MCLSRDVMIETADFEVMFVHTPKRFVKDQDLNKTITKVVKRFNGDDNLSTKQRDEIANFTRSKDALVVCQRDSGNRCYFN